MDAATAWFIIPALVCPLAMGALMWIMMRQTGAESASPAPTLPTDPGERLALLRAQRDALETEIAELSRVVQLEAERDGLRAETATPRGTPLGSAD